MPTTLAFETLALWFFAGLGTAALLTRLSVRRRVLATGLSALMAVTALTSASLLPTDLRLWLGHLYLVAGYWVPATMAPSTIDVRFEGWLARMDARLHAAGPLPPSWAVPWLELSYLLCYVMVPAAFLVVWTGGTTGRTDTFWTAVLLAGFVCYGTLPWLTTRPPRALGPSAGGAPLRRANEFVLARVSHGRNTFPSGHVAVSLAAAIEVAAVWPAAGAAMTFLALVIAVGAYAGRYHYGVDVVAGLAAGAVAAALVRATA